WFYTLMLLMILIMFPLLLISTSSNRFYTMYFFLARTWGKVVLYGMGFYPSVEAEEYMDKKKSYVLIANHTSMTDIMLMLTVMKNPFVFVGKKELARFPVFGFFYKKTSIMVDRSSAASRQQAYKEAQQRLKQEVSIGILPEGAVPEPTVFLDRFKDGAFRLAIEHQVPIVPITFADNKRRFPYEGLFSGSPGKMRVKIHRFIPTASLTLVNRQHLRDTARAVIYEQLLAFREEAKEKNRS
ncbi:MAG: 1-acyl-sn-glycerol-3-phosphate acyltransferase, partial [Sinomicrobium sp.]|nr:1-acyl-sn-glycerol-3-phosphate acyltransferase [Sinomicrobium sp.]